jgi:hypothetical protein
VPLSDRHISKMVRLYVTITATNVSGGLLITAVLNSQDHDSAGDIRNDHLDGHK